MAKWFGGNPQAGLSLIGVLIAVFVLAGSALALTQLLARTESVVGQSTERFVAVNLAREGLELVRAQRDSNWLANPRVVVPTPDPSASPTPTPSVAVPWTATLCDESTGARTLTVEHDGLGASGVHVNEGGSPALYRNQQGKWTHRVGAGVEVTPFERDITIDCIDQRSAPARITVTATVRWTRRTVAHSVVLTEVLYDWYR